MSIQIVSKGWHQTFGENRRGPHGERVGFEDWLRYQAPPGVRLRRRQRRSE